MAVGKQERAVTNIEKAIKELQDNLLVIAEIEKRQSALLREHSELHPENVEFRRRTEQNLAEITDKLNGLIGYTDGLHRPPSQ
jgi:predicted  nucleic acid-binding Zn-ribbon protein